MRGVQNVVLAQVRAQAGVTRREIRMVGDLIQKRQALGAQHGAMPDATYVLCKRSHARFAAQEMHAQIDALIFGRGRLGEAFPAFHVASRFLPLVEIHEHAHAQRTVFEI